MISHLLDQITAGPEYVIRLASDGTYFAADLKPAIFEGRNRYYLAVRTDSDQKDVLQALEGLAKLSSRDFMHVLVTQALPRRAHTVYFSIDHHGEQWASVAKNRTIALYWNSAPEDAEIELMVVGR